MAWAPFVPLAGYAIAELLNIARQNSNPYQRENQLLREDLRVYYDRQAEMMWSFIDILSQVRLKHIKSFDDLAQRDTEAKKALVDLARRATPIEMNGNNIGIFGLTSTGKSTLLNSLLGEKKAETGAGETTTQITPYPSTQFTLWDVPGRNDETV
ncbi:unnamed protein product, partial [Rotaria sordida]